MLTNDSFIKSNIQKNSNIVIDCTLTYISINFGLYITPVLCVLSVFGCLWVKELLYFIEQTVGYLANFTSK